MGYLHIPNLYRPEAADLLLFSRLWSLEKIHGTSAHVTWRGGAVSLSPGGETAARFAALFDVADLRSRFAAAGHEDVVVYGEAYGGRQQAQAWRYGPDLRFAAFDVSVAVGERRGWLAAPAAAALCARLGLEFVHYELVPSDLASLDAQRDAPSVQARRNGVAGDQPREGVVLRPEVELFRGDGSRLIAKHKRHEERETRTPREVGDPAALAVVTDADAAAFEWVTDTRMEHVLDKVQPSGVRDTARVLDAMVEDVLREGEGMVVDTPALRKAIRARASRLFLARAKAAGPG